MASASRRLPVSCENCRKRKIRCLSSGDQAPCDTCSHRGYAATCRFSRRPAPPSPAPSNDLVRKISGLEDLIRQNIDLTTASLGQRRPSVTISSSLSDRPSAITPESDGGSKNFPTGRLLKSPSNHVRYIPLNRVGDASVLEPMQEPLCDSLAGFPFASADPQVRQDLVHALPPPRHCDQLRDIFLEVFSPLFHILHEPTFDTSYREFKKSPQSTPLPFLALLYVVFSLAVTSLDTEHPLLVELGHEVTPIANIRALAGRYRSLAMRCLAADNFMIQHNLCTLQSLILLIYAISHTGEHMWSLLGSTLHIAIAIGCSVDPDHLNVDIVEAEERRRCWAGLMMLYTIQSTCFGNIIPFRIHADVALPANVNDDELLNTGAHPIEPSGDRLTQMSYLLCKFNLYNLGYEICRLSSSTTLPSRERTMSLDRGIRMELQKHMTLFEDIDNMPFYHVAHFYIVNNYAHHLSLLLHRPNLDLLDRLSPTESPPDNARQSCQLCSDSALKILSNYESFHRNPCLKPYHWYINGFGSFQAFLAITTLTVILNKADVSNPSKLAIATAVRSCIETFRCMAARSEMCTKALNILEPWIQTPLSNPPQLTLGGTSVHTPQISDSECGISDAWEGLPQLDNLIHEIPSEQWLLPSNFPWENIK